ncbi:MAG: hypothetical protein ABI920_09995 [Casimicrobiaceae bacterium]
MTKTHASAAESHCAAVVVSDGTQAWLRTGIGVVASIGPVRAALAVAAVLRSHPGTGATHVHGSTRPRPDPWHHAPRGRALPHKEGRGW